MKGALALQHEQSLNVDIMVIIRCQLSL
jgi:hypothetical protein